MTIAALLISVDALHPITFWMHLSVSPIDCETESSNYDCKFSNFLSTTAVLLWSLFRITFLQYDLFVFNACICCCRYLKFICAGSTAWIVKDNKPISFVNSKIDTCVFWRSSWHCFWTFETFFSGRDRFMINESTVTPKNSILCLGVNTDFFKVSTNPSCWRRKILCPWTLTFLQLYGLSTTCRPSKL